MKFAQQLSQGAVEEWRRAYIDYRLLKKLIKAAAKSQQEPGEDQDDDDGGASQPLRLPEPSVQSPDSSGVGHQLPSSSDEGDDQLVGRATSRPPVTPLASSTSKQISRNATGGTAAAGQSSARITRIQSRSSSIRSEGAPGYNASGGLQQRLRKRTGSRAPSFREPRWRYPPDLPLDKLMKQLNPQEKKFFQVLDDELEKVAAFYEERESEALERFKILREQLDQLAEHRDQYLAAHSAPSRFLRPVAKVAPEAVKKHLVPDGVLDGVDEHHNGNHNGESQQQQNKTNYPNLAKKRTSYLHFLRDPENYINARRKLKLAVFEYYKYLGYVKNYRLLNRTGFSKVTKKMEKVTRIKCQEAYMQKVHKTHFSSSTTIDDLQSQTETMFGASFEKGSRKRAIQRLRLMGMQTPLHSFAAWRAGLFIGLAIPPLIDGLGKGFQPDIGTRVPAAPALLQLYGALFLPVLLGLGIGLNLIGWTAAHINIPLVFYFDTRHHIDMLEYLEIPAFLMCSLCYCFWLSFTITSSFISPQVWPLVWIIGFIILLFNPLLIFYHHARWWLIRSTFRVFTAGLVKVEFRDFWLGDQFASLYYTAYNLGLIVCAYSHHWTKATPSQCSTNETWASPILASLPYLWRLGQSIRRYHDAPDVKTHLINAGKYAAGVVYLFAYFDYRIHGSSGSGRFASFIVFATINSAYSYVWDLLMDWNLCKRGSRHPFLRNELAYKNQHWFYYFAMVTNLFLRFNWVAYIFPHPDVRLKGFLVSLSETFRRWQWNFIRVESEHVGNIDGFRVTRDVPLPYVIAHSAAASMHADDDPDPEEVGRQVAFNKSFALGQRQSAFASLLPGEVGRKLKAAVLGTRSGAPDESDEEEEEEEDSPVSDVAAARAAISSPPGSGAEEESIGSGASLRSVGSIRNKRDRQEVNEQASERLKDNEDTRQTLSEQRHRNYNTFGWDSDVENVKTPDRAHLTP